MLHTTFTISGQHPSLAGHFPGHPVVPGVVILDAICQCIFKANNTIKINGIANVKFLMPLTAGTSVSLDISEKEAHILQFICSTPDGKLATGQLRT